MLNLGIGIGIDSMASGWQFDNKLSLYYSSRNSYDMLEIKSGLNLNAKILPSCGQVDANNYALKTYSLGGADTSGYIEFRCKFGTGLVYYIFTSCDPARDTRYYTIQVNQNSVVCAFREPAGSPSTNQAFSTTNAISDGWHTVRLTSDGASFVFTVDGNTNPTSGVNTGKWLAFVNVALRTNIAIGIKATLTQAKSTLGYIDYVDYNNTHKWVLTGSGKYIYDIIGTNHLTRTGTSIYYSASASLGLMDNGYSIWKKNVELDEIVPYKLGVAYDVSAFLTGYAKYADYPGGLSIYNGAPSLVDFDYNDTANSLVGIFKKDDTAIYITTASMIYYDATNKYRWRNDELLDPVVYSDTYKNIGYKGRVMNITTVSTIAKSISAILAYSRDQKGNNEWKLVQHCGLSDLVLMSENEPMYDGNNYLIWI